MTKGKSVPKVMSTKVHLEMMANYQKTVEELNTKLAYQQTIIGAQKEELEMKASALKQRLIDNQEIAASYGNLKREFEMLKTQYQNQLMADQVRLQDAIKDRNRAMGEAAGYFEKYMQASKPWYKRLFNSKTK